MSFRKSLTSLFLRRVYWRLKRPTFVVLLGAPGSGKGTLAENLPFPQLSTGNLFRAEWEKQTELGKQVKPIMDKGGLVPDDLTFGILKGALPTWQYAKGATFDGFPRTDNQAVLLDGLVDDWDLVISHVFLIDVTRPDLIERISGRRTCSNKACGKSYHVRFKKPKVDGICNACGSPLYIRDDDKPEVVAARLDKYDATSGSLTRYYEKHPGFRRLKSTNADSPDAVLKTALSIIQSGR